MEVDILSLFPDYFSSPMQSSMLGKAIKNGLLTVRSQDIRDFGIGKWRQVDDVPFGGGGMLLMAEPVVRAVHHVRREDSRVVYLSPQGHLLTAKKSRELAGYKHLVLLCGHYEGIDERALESVVDEEISIGDYVLTNGNLAALVVIDAMARFIPGVLGNQKSAMQDSLENGLLEGPQYTRPRSFQGMEVPRVLLQGHHQNIDTWRKQVSLQRTRERRPDLYLQYLRSHAEAQSNDSIGTITLVLEVASLPRSMKFYSRLFRLGSLDGEGAIALPGGSKLQFHEVGTSVKNKAMVTYQLDDPQAWVCFLKRWEMLGGTVDEVGGHSTTRWANDPDGHQWAVSCVTR